MGHNDCNDNSSNRGSQCVEGIAKILKNRIGDDIFLFERDGSRVFGNIKDVVRDSVLVLGPFDPTPIGFVQKTTCFCNQGPQLILLSELMLSICEITEFFIFSDPDLAKQIEPFMKTN